MDPEYLVFRRLEGGQQAFNIPYAYLSFRPMPERVNCYSEREGFEFAFWMPTLAPSKKEAFYANGGLMKNWILRTGLTLFVSRTFESFRTGKIPGISFLKH